MSDFNYPTTILTSKTPEQAALILPTTLNATTSLLDKKLSKWFNRYYAAVNTHNRELKSILDEGAQFFSPQNHTGEYGNYPRTWGAILTSLQIEHQNNERLLNSLKQDIIKPLTDVVQKDFRLSELLINSQELEEISYKLLKNDSSSEMQWNYKAPQIFENFEKFKTSEIQLLLNISLNFFQIHNLKWTKDLENNENATNYLLNNFKLNQEMSNYLNYIIKNEFKPVNDGFLKQKMMEQEKLQKTHEKKHDKSSKRMSGFHKDNQSILSENSEKSSKKPFKLKSKVGSIFGRRKKSTSFNKETNFSKDIIPESVGTNDSASSRANSRRSSDLYGLPGKGKTRAEQGPPSGPQGQGKFPQPVPSGSQKTVFGQGQTPQSVASGQFPPPGQAPSSGKSTEQFVAPPGPPSTDPSGSNQLNAPPTPTSSTPLPAPQFYTKPPTSMLNPPLTPKSKDIESPQLDSPNVVKYKDSETSSDEEEPETTEYRRLSMLQKHDLGDSVTTKDSELPSIPNDVPTFAPPPSQVPGSFPVDLPRSRESSGKYSFESGDEKPISGNKDVFNDEVNLPEPDITGASPIKEKNGAAAPIGATSPLKSNTSAPPPPPPSRKVIHHEPLPALPVSGDNTTSVRTRKDVTSQIFHNLPSARDSMIQPSFGQAPLISQDTGNSLLKHHDSFKHSDAAEEVKGLNSSVAEVINANFKDGKLTKSQIIGEVAFNYKPHEESNINEPIVLKIPNNFDKLILNNTFVEKLADNEFRISPAQIASKSLGGLKYLLKLNEEQVPIIVQQIWKYEDHQSSLMISLRLNPGIQKLVLNNLVISVALNEDIETLSASSKPQGSFNKDKNRITWRYNQPLVLGGDVREEKLIARFMTNGKGSEHESGVQVKFQLQEPIKYVSIYEDGEEIPVVRNMVSGSYSGHT
jgi:SAFF domain.